MAKKPWEKKVEPEPETPAQPSVYPQPKPEDIVPPPPVIQE